MRRYRPIPGYPKYRISDDGVVLTTHKRSRSPGGVLKLSPDKDGYLIAGLWNDEKKRQERRFVHYLVLLTFVGPRPEGKEGCHNNGNRQDNRVNNLRWDTPKGNHGDAVRAGTHTGFTKRGENNPFAKLTSQDVLAIRQLILQPPYNRLGGKKLLAARFSISSCNLKDILQRKIWRHI